MWDAIFEVLREKAAAGVDVRLIYDDVGCFLRLPKNFTKELAKHKIKAVVFNAIHPMLTTKQNNRDHRKITVIDGKVAFTGGINIADEYINQIERFGHWKDAGIKIEGAAVWSFVLFFLQMWFYCTKEKIEDPSRFYPVRFCRKPPMPIIRLAATHRVLFSRMQTVPPTKKTSENMYISKS